MKSVIAAKLFLISLSILLAAFSALTACQNGSTSTAINGNEGGSEPVNEQEGYEMQRAVNRCHRTGGTRVVKIKGELKCY